MQLKCSRATLAFPDPARHSEARRPRTLISLLIAALAAAPLAGCVSNPLYEGGRAWAEGWREGQVEQVGFAGELGYEQNYDCRYRNGGDGRKNGGRFAVVGLQNMGRHRHHVVPIGEERVPRVGERVLTRPDRCDPPVQRAGR